MNLTSDAKVIWYVKEKNQSLHLLYRVLRSSSITLHSSITLRSSSWTSLFFPDRRDKRKGNDEFCVLFSLPKKTEFRLIAKRLWPSRCLFEFPLDLIDSLKEDSKREKRVLSIWRRAKRRRRQFGLIRRFFVRQRIDQTNISVCRRWSVVERAWWTHFFYTRTNREKADQRWESFLLSSEVGWSEARNWALDEAEEVCLDEVIRGMKNEKWET